MSAHNGENRDEVPPELLAAYADGELTAAECRRVEAWLAAHPEARADVEAQRRLARLFEEAAPPPPGEEQWADALARLEQYLATPPARRPAWRRRATVAVAALVAAAAVVLLAFALKDPTARTVPPDGEPQAEAEEPWPVASADDVEILSMDDRDRGTLVIGEPPVNEPLELLTEDEVQVNKLPDGPGRVGRLRKPPGSGTPMVVLSLEPDPEEAP
jgi:anti-sigma factor RsiW